MDHAKIVCRPLFPFLRVVSRKRQLLAGIESRKAREPEGFITSDLKSSLGFVVDNIKLMDN